MINIYILSDNEKLGGECRFGGNFLYTGEHVCKVSETETFFDH